MTILDNNSLKKCNETISLAKNILRDEGIGYFIKKGKPSSNGVVRNWSFALSMNEKTGRLGRVFFRVRPEQETPVKVSPGKVYLEYYDPDRKLEKPCKPLKGIGGVEDNYVYREIDVATHVFSEKEKGLFKHELLTALSTRKKQ